MKRFLGGLALLMGAAILAGVGYNLLAGWPQGLEVNALAGLPVALAMIFCGARWVRGEPADGNVPESDAAPASRPQYESQVAPSLSPLDRLRTFDLSHLNWLGWLLLLCTFGLVIVGSILLASSLDTELPDKPWVRKAIMVPVLLLAVGFFFAVRWLLAKIGITIYRQ